MNYKLNKVGNKFKLKFRNKSKNNNINYNLFILALRTGMKKVNI